MSDEQKIEEIIFNTVSAWPDGIPDRESTELAAKAIDEAIVSPLRKRIDELEAELSNHNQHDICGDLNRDCAGQGGIICPCCGERKS